MTRSEPSRIVDSHVHLWPASSANPEGHAWMQLGHHLTRQYSVEDYVSAVSAWPKGGFVYVETDRFLPAPPSAGPSCDNGELRQYVAEPLKEIQFLRRVVEGLPRKGEGHTEDHASLLKGIVAWAPVQLGPDVLARYLGLVEKEAGQRTWHLLKGFRFLLQGIHDRAEFEELVFGTAWLNGLRELGERGFSFDIGVDQRQGGVWQLKAVVEMVRKLRESGCKTVFVLDHLCKPDFQGQLQTDGQKEDFTQWCAALENASKYDGVYVKLSGAFSELGDQDPADPWPVDVIVDSMIPWLDALFRIFPPSKIMFGSDWPVCCVGGPGDEHSWKSWKATVLKIIDRYQLSNSERERIWHGTATEAYKLEAW